MSKYHNYKKKYEENNEACAERYGLMKERIQAISLEETVPEKYQDYFKSQATFLKLLCDILEQEQNGALDRRNMDACRELNEKLYADQKEENYGDCYGNPDYTCDLFGEELGRMLAFLYSELRAGVAYAFEGSAYHLTLLLELFVEIYNFFEASEEAQINTKEIRQSIYWFFHDYSEVFAADAILEMIDPDYDFYTGIVMESDLNDLTYLYRYGLPIGANEIGIAEFLNQMDEAEVQAMADTYTEGYRIGFEVTGKDLSIKKTVNIHYPVGFERMVRAAIQNFEKMGLRPTIFREPLASFQNRGSSKRGCYSTSVNRQYDFDHREDKALYFEKTFVERRLEVLRTTFEEYKKMAGEHAGPAVIEVFGEVPFAPVNKSASISYSDKQQELNVYNASMSGQITNAYIKGEERSFTIIAYPIPEIGDQFQEIFAETVKINTLDYKLYQTMQQKIIDVLDQAEYVHILGAGDNKTDLTVAIRPLEIPEKQTAFENCVADVNIPVGEVFTSPVLKGTNGLLHVTEVFLEGLQYKNLQVQFTDGMITAYDCTNFAQKEENQKYIKDNVLMHHDTLPMGEFAIGTNTTAYRMGIVYQINDKLPILIAEKTGPHFAVGDTCYSHCEDTSVYNPNGKEIMARDNEISVLRTEDMSKAYFNCHTDITIPYNELDSITVIRKDGSTVDVIRGGRFVVPGTEALNEPLDEL